VNVYHHPVMLAEVMHSLITDLDGVYVDATIGGGGHAQALLERLSGKAILIGIDRDEEAITIARNQLGAYAQRVRFIQGSFSQIAEILMNENLDFINGILFDLGVSSWQLDSPQRGFSFSKDGPLDMRMDQKAKLNASQVVNNFPEKDLADILYLYGEERHSYKIARAIVNVRQKKPITTTRELENIVWKCVPKRQGGIHPATRTFMALRIYVNRELDELSKGLEDATRFLKEGARLVVLSYHSLEDRIVKCFFKNSDQLDVLTRKPIIPSQEEILSNPRARSARMRVAQKSAREEGIKA